ncbi:MAG: DEAD/DEAH box helicase [Prevotella sp.]|nr:DEAD/DEAH box helicase [Bacteroidales bacterium]MDY3843410.1 DEAD/DEAH box helicase [Prevotella sp.]
MKTIEEILDKCNIRQLNEMQIATSEAILNTGKDLMLLSPTGSGKTLAYLLPLTQRINPELDAVQAIVVVPGRELALQSATVLKDMATGLRAYACYGGRAAMDEHRQLRQVRPHVIFSTPGRMNDHLGKGNIDTKAVKWIILDEFDKCLEMGFHDEMAILMRQIPACARQILLSATPAEEMHTQQILRDQFAVLNFLPNEGNVPARVCIRKVQSPEKDKLETLRRLLCQLGDDSSIVFLNYRESVERTAAYLEEHGFTISSFHGGLEQKQREDALYRFSNGSANILVSTDLASRGLDIPDIRNIIHYHLPEGEDGYIHRVGRTARWDAHGDSYFILGPEESIPDYVDADVEDYELSTEAAPVPVPRMATIYIGKGKKDKISKGDIVGLLCKQAGLSGSEIGRIDVKDYYAYVAVVRSKLMQVLKQLNGQKIKGLKTLFEAVR